MEHIVQFAINIDDEKIRDVIESRAEKQIIEKITQQVTNKLFESRWGKNADPTDPLQDWVVRQLNGFLEKNKEAIIQGAVKAVSEKLSRTKAAKEAVNKVIADIQL